MTEEAVDRRRTGDPLYVIVMKSTDCTAGGAGLKASSESQPIIPPNTSTYVNTRL